MDREELIHFSEEVFNQLGGFGSVKLMTGASNFKCGEENKNPFVSFRFKGCDKVNYVKYTLTPLDLYEVEYGLIFMSEGIPTYQKKNYVGGLYCDDIKQHFEKYTGLYLTLFP